MPKICQEYRKPNGLNTQLVTEVSPYIFRFIFFLCLLHGRSHWFKSTPFWILGTKQGQMYTKTAQILVLTKLSVVTLSILFRDGKVQKRVPEEGDDPHSLKEIWILSPARS